MAIEKLAASIAIQKIVAKGSTVTLPERCSAGNAPRCSLHGDTPNCPVPQNPIGKRELEAARIKSSPNGKSHQETTRWRGRAIRTSPATVRKIPIPPCLGPPARKTAISSAAKSSRKASRELLPPCARVGERRGSREFMGKSTRLS